MVLPTAYQRPGNLGRYPQVHLVGSAHRYRRLILADPAAPGIDQVDAVAQHVTRVYPGGVAALRGVCLRIGWPTSRPETSTRGPARR